MARFYGKIGFGVSDESEISSVIHDVTYTERYYHGDMLRHLNRWDNGESINDNFNISNELSIVADRFAYENLNAMRYVELYGTKWAITSAEIQDRPRIKLSIGGVYNA